MKREQPSAVVRGNRLRPLQPSSRLVLALTALGLLAACRRNESSEVRMECSVQPQPPRMGPAEVQIALTDLDQAPVRGAQISLEADMSHPGMKPSFEKASETGAGRYQSKLNFDMAGDWTLLLHAKLANGGTVDKAVKLTVLEK